MNKISRLGAFTAFLLMGSLTQANFIYNVIISNVAFSPSGQNVAIPWFVSGPFNSQIDFVPGAVPVTVGNNTPHSAATVNIIYEVDSSNAFPVNEIGLVITGAVVEWGRILWTEVVEDVNGVIVGSASGQFLGSSYAGGSDGPFNFSTPVLLSQSLTRYKVKKNFFLGIGPQTLPTTSLASLGIIEQNAVPEPATIAAVSLGLAALAARRKNKKK